MEENWDNVIIYVVKMLFTESNMHYKNGEVRKIERLLVFDSRLSVEDVKKQIEVTTMDKFEIISLSKKITGLYKSKAI